MRFFAKCEQYNKEKMVEWNQGNIQEINVLFSNLVFKIKFRSYFSESFRWFHSTHGAQRPKFTLGKKEKFQKFRGEWENSKKYQNIPSDVILS